MSGLDDEVDAIFLVDIVVNLFLPYRAPLARGGMLVTENRKIACHYLRTWMLFDIVTSTPIDVIVATVTWQSSRESRELRTLKLLRVLKLTKILRASSIISRWQDRIALSWSFVSLVKFSTLVFVLAHWLACLWSSAPAWVGLWAVFLCVCVRFWGVCGWVGGGA